MTKDEWIKKYITEGFYEHATCVGIPLDEILSDAWDAGVESTKVCHFYEEEVEQIKCYKECGYFPKDGTDCKYWRPIK